MLSSRLFGLFWSASFVHGYRVAVGDSGSHVSGSFVQPNVSFISTKYQQVTPMCSDSLSGLDVPAFVIGLGVDSPRMRLFNKRARELKLHNMCWVRAISYLDCTSLPVYHQDWRDTRDARFPPALGLAHRKIWRHMVEHDIKVALIFEDDGIGEVSSDFCDALQQTIKDGLANRYDIARLGHHYSSHEKALEELLDVEEATTRIFTDRQDLYARVFHRSCAHSYGTYAYAITLQGANKSIEGYNPETMAVDHFAKFSTANEMNVSCFYPPIVKPARVPAQHVIFRSQLNVTREPHMLPCASSHSDLQDPCPQEW